MRIFQKRRAFTLTEITIVLGIVGLILGVIWQQFQVLRVNKMTSQEMQQLTAIAQNIRSMYGSGTDLGYTTFSDATASMVKANVFPADMPLNVYGYPTVAEGGFARIDITPNSPGANSNQFEVEFLPLPQTCSRLLQLVTGAYASLDVAYVYDGTKWQNPANGPLNFTGCTYASFTFRLH